MKKLLYRILFTILGILCVVGYLSYFFLHYHNAEMVDYAPSIFNEDLGEGFYYSINNEMKFANNNFFDKDEKTIWQGEIIKAIPSPDKSKVFIMGRDSLYVVDKAGENPIAFMPRRKEVVSNEDTLIYNYGLDMQWAPESENIFLTKYLSNKNRNYIGKKGLERLVLIQYKLVNASFEEVAPVYSGEYFFCENYSGVFFTKESGVSFWNDSTGAISSEVDLNSFCQSDFFYSFNGNSYSAIKSEKGFGFKFLKGGFGEIFFSKNGLKYKLELGRNIKGAYPNIGRNSFFTANDKYFLLQVNWDDYVGTLLFDLKSGKYKELPRGTIYYHSENTRTLKHFKVSNRNGIVVDFPKSAQ